MSPETQKKSLRILQVIARLNVGGPAVEVISICRELRSRGHSVLLVCGRVGPHEGDMTYLAREAGLRPRVIPELGREISPGDDLKCLRALRRIIRGYRPHIIHTHTAKAGTLGRIAAWSVSLTAGVPSRAMRVHTFHGHVFHGYFGPAKSALFVNIERFLSRLTDCIVTISPLQKADICRRYRISGEKKVRVIPLGFDFSAFEDCGRFRATARDRLLVGQSLETFLVGAVGRLTSVKNHSLLLKAVGYLKERGRLSPLRVALVGDGELRKELEAEAAALGVSREVLFAGWQKEMPAVYGALDALALTSRNEGTPVTVMEAMAARKPVVATDVGGVRDLMGETIEMHKEGFMRAENGVVVPPDDAPALAGALRFIMENRPVAKRMAERAQRFVSREYSLERVVRDMENLYDELTRPGLRRSGGNRA